MPASLGSSPFFEFHDMDDHISQGSSWLEQGESSTMVSYKSMPDSFIMSSILEIDLIPSDSIYHLRCIVERMIAAKYFRECVRVYGSIRKSAVDASFKKFSVKILSIDDIESLKWEALNAKIGIYTTPF
ncbi:hypothetical protein R6Q59_036215 [Mikania micrantha]